MRWVPIQQKLVEPTQDHLLIRFQDLELNPKLSKGDFNVNKNASLLFRKDIKTDPALVLGRLINVAEAVMRRSAYLSLLNENPSVLDRLVEICRSSAYLAQEIARHPVLLDELIDARIFVDPPTSEDVDEELTRALAGVPGGDVEDPVLRVAGDK